MTPDRSIMVRTAEWLLGLDQIRLGHDAPVFLRWNSPYPGWLILALSLVVLVLITLAYQREPGRSSRRILLATLRGALIGLVVAMLCRPVLILQRNRVSPSHVALLIDTSASMAQTDRYIDSTLANGVRRGARLADGEAASQISRLELVRRALTADDAEALRALLRHNHLRTYHFSGQAKPLGTAADPADLEAVLSQLNGLSAEGTTTNLARSLEGVLRRTEGGRLAAVILAGDGRSTEPTTLAGALVVAKAQQVPIYPLMVGSPLPPRDVGIGALTWDGNVFAKDIFAVHVRLEATGLASPTPVTVQLVEEGRNRVVAAETVEVGGAVASKEIELRTKPARAGLLRYRVEVLSVDGDADAANDIDVVDVWVRDRPTRVLYVEQLPRFEYRYLKNALVREDTMRASVLLLAADAEFAQEGTAPIRRFPETPEELEEYDVVLFGDVDPTGDWLTGTQARMLVDFVGRHGGGFGLIAGERNVPQRFRGTVLEKLIPVHIDPDFLGSYATTLTTVFAPRLTPEGRRSRLFRFDVGGSPPKGHESWPEGEEASIVRSLPGWYWFARTRGPRPGAEVLLEHPTEQADDGPMPLVVAGRYGAGKVLFHASDDTWRWRRGTGGLIYDGYWIQVIRALSPAHAADAEHRLVIRPSKRRYHFGERVDVQVRITDPELLPGVEEQVRLTVHDEDGQPVAHVDGKRLSGASPLYEGSFIPPGPGTFSFSVDGLTPVEPAFQPVGAAPSIRVEQASLEFRRPEADHAILERIAAETGGELVALDRLTEVFGQVRDRSVRIPDDVSEPLWDSRLAFILFAMLLTSEWILRKAHGMI